MDAWPSSQETTTRRAPFSWRTSVGSGCGSRRHRNVSGGSGLRRRGASGQLEGTSCVLRFWPTWSRMVRRRCKRRRRAPVRVSVFANSAGAPLATAVLSRASQAHAAESRQPLPVRPDRLQVLGEVHLVAVALGLHRDPRHADLDVDARAAVRRLLLHVTFSTCSPPPPPARPRRPRRLGVAVAADSPSNLMSSIFQSPTSPGRRPPSPSPPRRP